MLILISAHVFVSTFVETAHVTSLCQVSTDTNLACEKSPAYGFFTLIPLKGIYVLLLSALEAVSTHPHKFQKFFFIFIS